MNKIIRTLAILAVCALALGLPGLAYAADANPPERMTYQGYLVDADGDPLGTVADPSDQTERVSAPANYDVVFRIYDVKQDGLAVWGEQQTITVDNGYFSVLLGEGVLVEAAEGIETLSDVFKGDDISDRFIGITVSGLVGQSDVEVAPRLRLVSSPFAFTASQARRLTDGVGNNNFFKEGSSLKLGAGANPTLILPDSGGATLEGMLTATLPGSGAGLQIVNGSNSTTLGANSSDFFELSTSLDKVLVNDDLYVKNKIYSWGTHLTLGPSNNTDTYLKINSSSDSIEAAADKFTLSGDEYWWDLRFSTGQADLVTTAGKFKMNKSLEVDGRLWIKDGLDIVQGASSISPKFSYTNPKIEMFSGDRQRTIYTGSNFIALGMNHSQHTTGWTHTAYYGGSGWVFSSDRRLKEEIKDVEPVLDRLLDVQVRRFKWKGAPSPELTDIGVIAQELEPLFPGLISTSYDEELEDDALSVQYTAFGVLAVKGLQELKAEKDEQLARKDERIKALEERLARLEELVGKMGQQQ